MIATIGLDLAKNVFQIHGVDARGRVVMKKTLRRAQVLTFFGQLPPCLVGMEACGGAHFWARKLQGFGHTVRLMAPQFVKPYVKSQKNDAADAEAICEAVTRPSMRFVPIKSIDQQAILAVHRVRQGLVKLRTAQVNQVRCLLAEVGLVLPRGIQHIRRVPLLLDEAADTLPTAFCLLMRQQYESIRDLDRRVAELEGDIRRWHRENTSSRRLAEIPGVGPLTASALVATIGDASTFDNGRQLAAWIGLVPRQCSSGGKPRLLGIGKRGDGYLRGLLVHGARSIIASSKRHLGAHTSGWLGRLLVRRHVNIAIVAQANRTARIVWALLRHGDTYRGAGACAA
jgi:transposase